MTNLEAECFKCGTPIWVPNYEYVSDRNFCYPCANSYMGALPVVTDDETINKARMEQEIG